MEPLHQHDQPGDPVEGLKQVLSDKQIEANGEKYYTVYSNIACPGKGEMWYTFGGYPAAGNGNWQKIAGLW